MNIPSALKTAARSALLGTLALGALGTIAAFAQETAPAAADAAAAAAPAAPAFTVDKGDTTWMLISTVLVLLMTIPGLALFYGGLVRAKNMLSVLMQVFTITCGGDDRLGLLRLQPRLHAPATPIFGGFSKMFLAGVDVDDDVGNLLQGRGHPRAGLRRSSR